MPSNTNNWTAGKIILVSAGAGLIVLLLLLLWLGFAFWASFFWGLIVGGIVYIILALNFSGDADGGATGYGGSGEAKAGADGQNALSGAQAARQTAETESVASTTAPGAAAKDVGAAVKTSPALTGQAEAAGVKERRKSDAGSADTSADKAAAKPAPAPADAGEDYDKDGVQEGTNEGSKPAMLKAARKGGADNLKEIKGVGPAMEKLLNGLGVFHFDQIAGWSADEVAWVDANLKGFKGRVSRDNWVDQAKILMTGAETEFSKRVEDGKVY